MGEPMDYTFSGPEFVCRFSAIDQVTPPIYSRRILIFSSHDVDRDEAILALRLGLERTVNEIPILAGQMGHDGVGWTIKNGSARLRIKEIDMSFSDLKASNFSETMLPADLVSSVPTLADPQSEWHCCRIQANFIQGGLLLVISINHTAMDGYGITMFIQALSRNCRVGDPTPRSCPAGFDRSGLFESLDGPGNVDELDAYSLVTGTPNLGPISSNTTTTFHLPVLKLKALKKAASSTIGWISTQDAVNALCWRTHARGRYLGGLISDDDVARFAFPVDFRSILNSTLSANYTGNAVLMTKVELPIRTLLGDSGLSQAAAAIRAGVTRVNEAYVINFIAVAKSLERPGQLKINMKLKERNTAFGSTSYKSFGLADLQWDNAIGIFERMRLASGVTGEGMSIILPVLRDRSWEVTVTLEEELFEAFSTDREWLQYMSR